MSIDVTTSSARTRRLHRRRRVGFTLIEATMSVAIVGVLAVASLTVVGRVAAARTIQARQCAGPALARRLVGEIVQSQFKDEADLGVLGPEATEVTGNRGKFDDVDDYLNWSESPPQDKDGTPIAGFAGWRRDVSVEWITPALLQAAGTATDLKRITVTVTDPQGRKTGLVAHRYKDGNYEQPPLVETTFVSHALLDLQIGAAAGGGRSVAGANLTNQAKAQ